MKDFFMQHYSDVKMGAMVSPINGVSTVYSTVYTGARQRKHQSSVSLAFVRGIHTVDSEFPSQKASNAENVSNWWRHHGMVLHKEDVIFRVSNG